MKCCEAMDLLSPYLDGELAAAKAATLEDHLKTCVTCREEMETLRLISRALKAEADTVQAPPDFAKGVMTAIGKRQGPWYSRVPGIWKRAVAVAAALALIAAGSLQMGLGQLLMRGGPQVAENPPGPGVTEPELQAPQTEPGAPTAGKPGQPGDPATPDDKKPGGEEPNLSVEGENTPGETEARVTKPVPSKSNVRTPGADTPVAVTNYQERVFLSKQRTIRSTLLKVRVDNVSAALNQALRLGGTYGADFQAGERISNGEIEVVRLTVGQGQAETLIERLAALGRTINRDSAVQDITGQFDRTREQYQGLLAKRSTVEDGSERAEIEATLRSLEGQLAEWDREAERYVIVLWLQP